KQRGAETFLFQYAHIHLQAALQDKADLIFALRQCLIDVSHSQNVLGNGFNRLGSVLPGSQGNKKIEVTYGFLASPQRARGRDRLDRFAKRANMGNEPMS